MFITKKHISRRAFLRGAGVTLALPLLDSMIPAQTPLAKNGRDPEDPLHRHLRSARHGAGILDPGKAAVPGEPMRAAGASSSSTR